MITVRGVTKTYKVAKREPGLKAALKSFVTREYTYIEALKEISFSVAQGEIVGYIGPNGAGKSTTVKILSGILVPTEGACEVMGRTPWEDRVAHVKNIGVVFGQRSQLMWDLPVTDSFGLLKDIYRVPEALYRKNSAELTEILGLSEFIQTPVRQLSLGQRMRCEIAASLLHSPPVLFLDEPTIGLDAVSKVAVRQFIKRINKENGTTVLLTTHDMGDVMALTDRVMLIGRGRIMYDGSFGHIQKKYDHINIITVHYDADRILAPPEHTAVISDENGKAVLSVDTLKTPVSNVINRLAETHTVRSIDVQPRPVEEIIAELYKEYSI